MTIAQIIGLIIVVVLSALGGFFIVKKSKNHNLIKWAGLFFFLSIALTWIFSAGSYNGAEISDYGMIRVGLTDIPKVIFNAIYLAGDKILFLLTLGCFYAVLTKVAGYKKLVNNIAETFKGKEILFTLFVSLIFVALSTLLNQTFIALIFVPFIVSIILSMGLDKITAFSVTFGSILIGLIGITYGSDGLYWLNQYLKQPIESVDLNITTGIVYRLLILAISYLLFNFFNILHIKKTLNDKKVDERNVDPFKVEKVEKKANAWPIAIILGLIFVISILGYISWSGTFGIEVFNKFHTWLMEIKIGDFAVFSSLLGSSAKNAAFGLWDFYHINTILIIVSIIVALIGRVKFNDYISACGEGIKKIGKPVILYILVYMIFIVTYMSPFVPTINNIIYGSINKFNPFLVSLISLISNVFETDLGYTGFIVGQFFTAKFVEYRMLIQHIFSTMYGFVQLCIPTSAILLIGLSYLNIDYKTWMKYIWIFVLSILVILLVLTTILAYI